MTAPSAADTLRTERRRLGEQRGAELGSHAAEWTKLPPPAEKNKKPSV